MPTPSGLIAVSYLVGGPPAALAGLVLGVYQCLLRNKKISVGKWHATLAGLVIGAGATIVILLTVYSHAQMDIAAVAPLGAAAGAICGFICWLITGKFSVSD